MCVENVSASCIHVHDCTFNLSINLPVALHLIALNMNIRKFFDYQLQFLISSASLCAPIFVCLQVHASRLEPWTWKPHITDVPH